MSAGSLKGMSVAVAGAGVFGSAVAVALARAGAGVIMIDPAPPADNASGVAAGMLAPAFEALLDAPMAGRFAMLKAARNRWPAFLGDEEGAASLLTRSGAAWVDRPGAAPMRGGHTVALAAMGARTEAYDRPWGPGAGVLTTDDWLIDPVATLGLLASELARHGGLSVGGRVVGFEAGYAAPGAEGLKVGATMEPGLTDRRSTPTAVEALRALAVALFPELAEAPFESLAGIRAACPDGMPLVGPSTLPGVMLAVGARRNGWLLAPLVAAITAAYLAGDDPGPDARAFDPGRFGPG